MAQQHDIVLTLQAKQFETQITKAHDLLIALDDAARQLQNTLNNTFNKLNIGGAVSQINSLANAIKNVGDVNIKSDNIKNVGAAVQDTQKTIQALDTTIKSVGQVDFTKPLYAGFLNLKTAAKDLRTGLDELTDKALKKLERSDATQQISNMVKVMKDGVQTVDAFGKKVDAVGAKLAAATNPKGTTGIPDPTKLDPTKLYSGFLKFELPDPTKNLYASFLKFESAIKPIKTSLESVGQEVKKTKGFADALTHSLGVGLAHSFGAITAGANPFISLLHEIPRNLAIGAFNYFFKRTVEGFGQTTKAVEQTGEAAKKATTDVGYMAKALSDASGAGGAGGNGPGGTGRGFGEIFKSIDKGAVALGATLLLLGVILDKIGDKLLAFTEGLANKAGEANLAFTQLNAVIQATGESIGANLGSTEQWAKFLKELAITSGTSRKELSDFATAFVQVGADAGLSGQELQKLVEIAAFTKDRFRNATEQLTNFRQALAGNVRFLQNNIPIGTDLNAVTERYSELLQRQGKSLEEANKAAKEASTSQKVLAVLQEASIPFIKTAIETTGSYSIELRKLKASIENLQISLGSGIEPIFASLTKTARGFINTIAELPEGVQKTLGVFTTLLAVITEVSGKILKLIGIITLARVAYITLNQILGVTIPLLGTSLSTLATSSLAVAGPIQPLTNLKDILLEVVKVFKNYFIALTSGTTIVGLIGKAIGNLGSLLAGLITRFVTLGAVLGALKFGVILTLITATVEALKNMNKEGEATKGILELLNAITGATTTSLTELAEAFGISERAGAAFNLIAGLIQKSLTGLAYAANLAALSYFEYSAAQNRAREQQARQAGNTKLAADFAALAERQEKSALRLNKALDALEQANKALATQSLKNNQILFASREELEQLKREAVDAGEAIEFLGKKIEGSLSADQLKILDRLLKSLRGEVDQLRVKQIELVSGKAAAEQAKALLRVKEAATEINETQGIKLFKEGEIENAKSVEEILKKIEEVSPEKANELRKALDLVPSLAKSNEALEQRKKLFTDIITQANALGDAFSKELKTTLTNLDAQYKFNEAILSSTNDYDALIKKAQLELEVKKATEQVDNRIAEIRDRIAKGKVEVLATGQTVRVQLNEAEKRKANEELNALTKNRRVLIDAAIDAEAAKRVSEIISDFQRRGEALNKIFVDDSKQLSDQGKLIEAYTQDLAKGTKFAQDQAELRAKDLDLSNKIREAQLELLRITTLLRDENNNLDEDGIRQLTLLQEQQQALYDRLKTQKDLNIATAASNQNKKSEQDFLATIQKTNEDLRDQIDLLEIRAKLYAEGILSGDFNKTEERVNILTNALENYYKELIKIRRESNPSLLNETTVADTIAKIEEIKSALKNAQFIKDIRELLQTIPDAIGEAMTEGVRGVLQGTQKIQDLFRNMASNIALSLSNIFAKRALKGIGDVLDDIANKIAQSNIVKDIAKKLGIDIGKPLSQIGVAAPSKTIPEAMDKNTTAQDLNTAALDRLTQALGGAVPVKLPDLFKNIPVFDPNKVGQAYKDINGPGTSPVDNLDKEFGDMLRQASTVFEDAGKIIEEDITGIGTSLSESLDLSSVKDAILDKIGAINTSLNEVLDLSAVRETIVSKIDDLGLDEFRQQLSDNIAADLQLAQEQGISLLAAQRARESSIISDLSQFSQDFTLKFEEVSQVIGEGVNNIFDNFLNVGDVLPGEDLIDSTEFVDDFVQEFSSSFDDILNDSSSLFGGFFDGIGSFLESGLDSLLSLGSDGFGSLFSSLGSLLQSGLSSLTSGIGSLFSGGGDIFGSLFSGLFSLFGFAKGGRIPGTASTKDDQLTPVASGEYITNSKAVDYYGEGFFDKLNNMSLPKDYFSNLQDAPSQISDATPRAAQVSSQAVRNAQVSSDNRPIVITVVDKSPKLDPAAFKMKPSEVTQIFVDGIKKDRVIRKVIREDLQNGRV